jgi:hypothetical protein
MAQTQNSSKTKSNQFKLRGYNVYEILLLPGSFWFGKTNSKTVEHTVVQCRIIVPDFVELPTVSRTVRYENTSLALVIVFANSKERQMEQRQTASP